MRYRILALSLAALLAGPLLHSEFVPPSWADSPPLDIVISGGRVMDPESSLDAIRNVGIREGKIVEITENPLLGTQTIEAHGLVVAPGFIDLHEHGQEPRNYEFQAHDGVTTSLELEAGTDEVSAWYARREGKSLINFGVSVGHIPVRMRVMHDPGSWLPTGDAAHKAASPQQIRAMKEQLETGLHAGALAVGMGINYTAGATHEEILEMFRVAAKYNAPVDVHVRYYGVMEPFTGIAAVEEVLAAAAATGAPLHVVHISSIGLQDTPLLIQLIAAARSRGLDVTTECYPYIAASTGLESAIFDPGWQERMGITFKDLQWTKTGERLTAETFVKYRQEGGTVVIFSIPKADARAAVADPMIIIASDGMQLGGKVHPRGQGTFSRVLGHYVREEKALDLMTALRKMTLLPAQRLEKRAPMFANKGRMKIGADADLTVFDPRTVLDKASFDDPLQFSTGIQYVLVNGVAVIKKGETVQGVFPGRAARAPISPGNLY